MSIKRTNAGGPDPSRPTTSDEKGAGIANGIRAALNIVPPDEVLVEIRASNNARWHDAPAMDPVVSIGLHEVEVDTFAMVDGVQCRRVYRLYVDDSGGFALHEIARRG